MFQRKENNKLTIYKKKREIDQSGFKTTYYDHLSRAFLNINIYFVP